KCYGIIKRSTKQQATKVLHALFQNLREDTKKTSHNDYWTPGTSIWKYSKQPPNQLPYPEIKSGVMRFNSAIACCGFLAAKIEFPATNTSAPAFNNAKALWLLTPPSTSMSS